MSHTITTIKPSKFLALSLSLLALSGCSTATSLNEAYLYDAQLKTEDQSWLNNYNYVYFTSQDIEQGPKAFCYFFELYVNQEKQDLPQKKCLISPDERQKGNVLHISHTSENSLGNVTYNYIYHDGVDGRVIASSAIPNPNDFIPSKTAVHDLRARMSAMKLAKQ